MNNAFCLTIVVFVFFNAAGSRFALAEKTMTFDEFKVAQKKENIIKAKEILKKREALRAARTEPTRWFFDEKIYQEFKIYSKHFNIAQTLDFLSRNGKLSDAKEFIVRLLKEENKNVTDKEAEDVAAKILNGEVSSFW